MGLNNFQFVNMIFLDSVLISPYHTKGDSELYIITKEMSKVDDYQDDYWHPAAVSKLSDVSKDLKLQWCKLDLWKVHIIYALWNTRQVKKYVNAYWLSLRQQDKFVIFEIFK